jgi:AcrR family transcriptional regulator
MDFQRARQPKQKEQRRATILLEARRMLDEGGVEAVTLSALAREVRLAKSNLYRYFPSLEAILLEVFREDFDGWADDLSTRLRRVRSRRKVERLAQLIAATFAARQRMCQLMSILPSVIERNVPVETIRQANAQLVERGQVLAAVMHEVIPELSLEAHAELVRYSYVLVAGLWPIAYPPPIALELADDPLFAAHRRDFESDLANGIGLIAAGMLRQSEPRSSEDSFEDRRPAPRGGTRGG